MSIFLLKPQSTSESKSGGQGGILLLLLIYIFPSWQLKKLQNFSWPFSTINFKSLPLWSFNLNFFYIFIHVRRQKDDL